MINYEPTNISFSVFYVFLPRVFHSHILCLMALTHLTPPRCACILYIVKVKLSPKSFVNSESLRHLQELDEHLQVCDLCLQLVHKLALHLQWVDQLTNRGVH